jgi:hypothetical protein
MADESEPREKASAEEQANEHVKAFFVALATKGKEAWNARRRDHEDVHVNLARVDFSKAPLDTIDFSGFEFGDWANFSGCVWRGAEWEKVEENTKVFALGRGCFNGATFGDSADFAGVTFGNRASFSGATFGDNTNFFGAARGDFAHFTSATFGDWAEFSFSVFGDHAIFTAVSFTGAAFGNHATFTGAALGDHAAFTGAAFGLAADFDQTHFKGLVDFTGKSESPSRKFMMDYRVF